MSNKEDSTTEKGIGAVEESLTKVEIFIEKNHKNILIGLVSVLVVVILYVFYEKYYKANKELEAQSEMFMAEKWFNMDSLNLALNGQEGNNMGFLEIVDEYGSTKQGNTAKLYVGEIYMKKGMYDDAIEYLADYKPVDKVLGPISQGLLGDAYMQKGDKELAIKYYTEAYKYDENEFTCPIYLNKAGLVYEDMGNYDKAIEVYTILKDKYKESLYTKNAIKSIAKLEELKQK